MKITVLLLMVLCATPSQAELFRRSRSSGCSGGGCSSFQSFACRGGTCGGAVGSCAGGTCQPSSACAGGSCQPGTSCSGGSCFSSMGGQSPCRGGSCLPTSLSESIGDGGGFLNSDGTRTVAVNGIPVPAGATGYQMVNGQPEWTFANGETSTHSNPGHNSASEEIEIPGPVTRPVARDGLGSETESTESYSTPPTPPTPPLQDSTHSPSTVLPTSPALPSQPNPIARGPANAHFFRFDSTNATTAGSLGACSATGVNLPNVSVPEGYCPAITTGQCLTRTLNGVTSRLLSGDTVSACRGPNSYGAKISIHTSTQDEPVRAIAVLPNEFGSGGGTDFGMLLVPCALPIKRFDLAETVSSEPGQIFKAFYPMLGQHIPGKTIRLKTQLNRTGNSHGLLSLEGSEPSQGESGSPVFLGTQLVGVISSGSAGNGRGSSVRVAAAHTSTFRSGGEIPQETKPRQSAATLLNQFRCENINPRGTGVARSSTGIGSGTSSTSTPTSTSVSVAPQVTSQSIAAAGHSGTSSSSGPVLLPRATPELRDSLARTASPPLSPTLGGLGTRNQSAVPSITGANPAVVPPSDLRSIEGYRDRLNYELRQGTRAIVLTFGISGCPPCRALRSNLNTVSANGSGVSALYVDAGASTQIPQLLANQEVIPRVRNGNGTFSPRISSYPYSIILTRNSSGGWSRSGEVSGNNPSGIQNIINRIPRQTANR